MNKFSKMLLMQVKSFPVHVDELPGTAAVTTCPFRLDTLCHMEFRYRRVTLPKKKD